MWNTILRKKNLYYFILLEISIIKSKKNVALSFYRQNGYEILKLFK